MESALPHEAVDLVARKEGAPEGKARGEEGDLQIKGHVEPVTLQHPPLPLSPPSSPSGG